MIDRIIDAYIASADDPETAKAARGVLTDFLAQLDHATLACVADSIDWPSDELLGESFKYNDK